MRGWEKDGRKGAYPNGLPQVVPTLLTYSSYLLYSLTSSVQVQFAKSRSLVSKVDLLASINGPFLQ